MAAVVPAPAAAILGGGAPAPAPAPDPAAAAAAAAAAAPVMGPGGDPAATAAEIAARAAETAAGGAPVMGGNRPPIRMWVEIVCAVVFVVLAIVFWGLAIEYLPEHWSKSNNRSIERNIKNKYLYFGLAGIFTMFAIYFILIAFTEKFRKLFGITQGNPEDIQATKRWWWFGGAITIIVIFVVIAIVVNSYEYQHWGHHGHGGEKPPKNRTHEGLLSGVVTGVVIVALIILGFMAQPDSKSLYSFLSAILIISVFLFLTPWSGFGGNTLVPCIYGVIFFIISVISIWQLFDKTRGHGDITNIYKPNQRTPGVAIMGVSVIVLEIILCLFLYYNSDETSYTDSANNVYKYTEWSKSSSMINPIGAFGLITTFQVLILTFLFWYYSTRFVAVKKYWTIIILCILCMTIPPIATVVSPTYKFKGAMTTSIYILATILLFTLVLIPSLSYFADTDKYNIFGSDDSILDHSELIQTKETLSNNVTNDEEQIVALVKSDANLSTAFPGADTNAIITTMLGATYKYITEMNAAITAAKTNSTAAASTVLTMQTAAQGAVTTTDQQHTDIGNLPVVTKDEFITALNSLKINKLNNLNLSTTEFETQIKTKPELEKVPDSLKQNLETSVTNYINALKNNANRGPTVGTWGTTGENVLNDEGKEIHEYSKTTLTGGKFAAFCVFYFITFCVVIGCISYYSKDGYRSNGEHMSSSLAASIIALILYPIVFFSFLKTPNIIYPFLFLLFLSINNAFYLLGENTVGYDTFKTESGDAQRSRLYNRNVIEWSQWLIPLVIFIILYLMNGSKIMTFTKTIKAVKTINEESGRKDLGVSKETQKAIWTGEKDVNLETGPGTGGVLNVGPTVEREEEEEVPATTTTGRSITQEE